MNPQININEIIEEIRRVNSEEKAPCLSFRHFFEKQKLAYSKKAMLRPFDGKWTLACAQAGVTPCEARDVKYLKPQVAYTKDQIREKLERMAHEVPEGISGVGLKKYGLSRRPIYRIWGNRGLEKACDEFGLKISQGSISNKELTLEHLADEFLQAALKLSPHKIPTLIELSNRAAHDSNSYSNKFGGYAKFKELAISHLFAFSKISDPTVAELFRAELEKLKSKKEAVTQVPSRPHEHGRILGFRAFAHVPTYEQDVVAMFAVIAQEIGFEIISNRNAFPDCEANRKVEGSNRNRYKKCLIEFEFRSNDFKNHKHPVNGCDLIVCWEHNWKDCPLEVLELKSKIRKLSGWK